jgi:lipopolysaccharide export system protein LptC
MTVDANVLSGGERYRIRTPEERARAFRSAARHSRLVALLRKGLPLFAVLVLASYFITSRLSVSVGVGDLTASIDGIEVADGNLRMTNPKLEGADKKNGKYRIGADYADQDMKAPNKIKLHAIKAELSTADGGWSRMNAVRGIFNNKTERLLMKDKIGIATSSGITGELKHATLDMKNQTLRSHQPVSFFLTRGSVKANALTFRSAESTLTFRGKVRVHLVKETKDAKDAKPEKKPAPPAEAEAPTVVPPLPEATGVVSESTGAVPVIGQ